MKTIYDLKKALFLALLWSISITSLAKEENAILIEAEGFDHYGGWLNDTQFMDVMGSPYLIAHGMGNPVEDASTTVNCPKSGKYRIWVRTYDWVARWRGDEWSRRKRAEGEPDIWPVPIMP